MAEWTKALVLKTSVGLHPTVGSNPTLSALVGACSPAAEARDLKSLKRGFESHHAYYNKTTKIKE